MFDPGSPQDGFWLVTKAHMKAVEEAETERLKAEAEAERLKAEAEAEEEAEKPVE